MPDICPASSEVSAATMPVTRDLILIVAATNRNMGIGKSGVLPWTGLRKEMQYFAKVTQHKKPEQGDNNVVIMGRKTWESIPARFRPLKSRTNVVISRSCAESENGSFSPHGFVKHSSLESALSIQRHGSIDGAEQTTATSKIFAIGGAQIYQAALALKETKFILLTRILDDFDCDTLFPVHLGIDGKSEGWERKSFDELRSFVDIDVPDCIQEENGTRYAFEMWERVAS